MGGERKPPAPHTHLPANRDPTAVNTLPSRIPHATLITVHFISSHITAIQLPPTLADAQLRELLVNATLHAGVLPWRYRSGLRGYEGRGVGNVEGAGCRGESFAR